MFITTKYHFHAVYTSISLSLLSLTFKASCSWEFSRGQYFTEERKEAGSTGQEWKGETDRQEQRSREVSYIYITIYYVVPWTSHQIRKIAGCACAGNAGNVFPRCRIQRKPPVSDRGMHHGTCVTHMPWCMSGLLTCGGGENVPGIPSACATRNFTYLARGPLNTVHVHLHVYVWQIWPFWQDTLELNSSCVPSSKCPWSIWNSHW